jgi:cystathionine beta-lyase/cystathionine gamma-synthase
MRATDKAVMGSLAVMSDEPQREPQHQPATRAITSGRAASGTSLAPALWASSVWQSAGLVDARRRATGVRCDEFYSRYSNPTVRSFEDAVADLEGAEASLAFASGMGAISSVVLALCSKGDHIVAQRNLYAATLAFLQGPCARFGIDVTFVDGTQPGAFAAALQPGRTMLVLAETPSNPCLQLTDLDEIGALRGPITVVDSTFATPLGQQPLAHGVHLSLHSATKGIAGHNDATLGVISGERDLIDAVWAYSVLHGATRCAASARSVCAPATSAAAPSSWPSRSSATRPCAPCTTPASRRIRSTSSRSGRCASSAPCWPSSSQAASRRWKPSSPR